MGENLIKPFSRTITLQREPKAYPPSKNTQGLYLKFNVRKLIIS